jgi:hypothetical protein
MWITLRLNATVQSPADGGDPENESQNDVSFSSSPLVVVDSGFAGDRVGVQLPSARGRFYSYVSDALSAACGAAYEIHPPVTAAHSADGVAAANAGRTVEPAAAPSAEAP